jgi:hypothetical protein
VSAAGRSSGRVEHDAYGTPAWCVHRCLEYAALPGGRWLESCAGDGNIIRAVNDVRQDVRWSAIEIRPDCEKELLSLTPRVLIGNFLAQAKLLESESAFDVLITNPPYTDALEVIEAGLKIAKNVCVLLRLGILETKKRALFFHENMPVSTLVLPNRPSFMTKTRVDKKTNSVKKTTTDAAAYAWFVFKPNVGEEKRRTGTSMVLDLTPKDVLKAARKLAPVVNAS